MSNRMQHNEPQIQCLVTTKMSTVSARIPVILDNMLIQYCRASKIRLCWLKRTKSTTDETEPLRIQTTLDKIKAESRIPTIRTIILIDEDNHERDWWKVPIQNTLKRLDYSITFCEMYSSQDMQAKVMEEKTSSGITSPMAHHSIQTAIDRYIEPNKEDFKGVSFARIEMEFRLIGDTKYPVLFPTKASMIEIAKRLYQSPRWTHEWYNNCRIQEANLPQHRPDGSTYNDANLSIETHKQGMPQIQCFITIKMSTVSATIPKVFTSMFEQYCDAGRFRFYHVNSLTATTALFNHVRVQTKDPALRIVLLIEEGTSDKKHRWWQEPLHAALAGKYSLTLIEMCPSKLMKSILIQEQAMLGIPRLTAIKKIEDTLQAYVSPVAADFPNIDFDNIKMQFSPVQSQTNRILFPSESCLMKLGCRMFLTTQWTKYWFSHWVKKTLHDGYIDTQSTMNHNIMKNNNGTTNNFVNLLTTSIMNSINM
jgi:hypothetical protein